MGGNGLIWVLVVAVLVIGPAIALVLLWIIAFKDDVERTGS